MNEIEYFQSVRILTQRQVDDRAHARAAIDAMPAEVAEAHEHHAEYEGAGH